MTAFNSDRKPSPNGINSQYLDLEKSNRYYHSEDALDLHRLFYLIWGHKWIILGVTTIGVLLAILIASLKTPVYQSNGSLMITESQNQYSYAGSDLGNLLTNSYGIGLGNSIADEIQMLQSRNLSKEIADTLIKTRLMPNGYQYPILFKDYPDDSTLAFQDEVAGRLRANLIFNKRDRESNLVNISFESPSSLEAAQVVNLTIRLYSELSTRQNRKSANAAVAFLEKERARIESQLNKTELQLQQYMDQNQLVQVDAQTNSLIDRLADLEQQRQEARTNLVAVNSALEQYQNQLNRIKPGLADQYADAIGPNMTRLQYQLAELKTERMQLLSENPELKNSQNPPVQLQNLNRQIEEYRNEIRSLTEQLLSKSDEYIGFLGSEGGTAAQSITELNRKMIELEIEKQQYQSQEEVLTVEINRLDVVFDDLPENMIGLARLQRIVTINEQLYITVSQQHAEMSLWQQTQFGKGQLVDEGNIPGSPIEPDFSLYLLVGAIMGLLLGMGYVFTKESFNTTIDGIQKLKLAGLPVLSVIPDLKRFADKEYDSKDYTEIKDKRVSTRMVALLDTVSPAAESFRRLETNILHSNPDTPLKSLVITSTTKGEGKTTIAGNIGIIMAEADQKILIVDTDLRRPNLHNMFGLERSPGITDVLFENAELGDVIKTTVIPNLYVLSAGVRPPNPSAITKSSSFLALMKSLEQTFDRIIIDTPPFGIITDSSSLMDQADGVIVISRFNKTKIGELEHTLNNLQRVDAKVLGTVLSGFDIDKNSDYYYGYNYYKEFYADYAEYGKT